MYTNVLLKLLKQILKSIFIEVKIKIYTISRTNLNIHKVWLKGDSTLVNAVTKGTLLC